MVIKNFPMKDTLAQQCAALLKREDVKSQLKTLFAPVSDYVSTEIYPYIYLIFALIFLIFIIVLAILVILVFILRNKQILLKIYEGNPS